MFLIRRIGFTLIATVLIAAFAASLQGQAKPGNIVIGFLIDSLKVERWQTDLSVFQQRAKELGATVTVETAEGDDELQFHQAEKLLNSGIGALVIVAHNTDTAARIVSLAKNKNVPVVCYERLIRNSDLDLFVGVDAEAIGELQAAALLKLAPKGNYVLIGGSPSDINAKTLRIGQMKVLRAGIERGDIRIAGDFWAADWKPIEAYTRMNEAIQSTGGNIAAVVASNDGTAGGAIQALEDHKLAGKVFVSGQDADLAAVVRILNGTQAMTIYRPLGSEAKQAAEGAVRLAKGEPVQTNTSVPSGSRTVPAILVVPLSVTRDNVMQTVIKDGFQNLDTIKKSLPPEKWPK
jgi:D-xylose transport system substrate-binding protein